MVDMGHWLTVHLVMNGLFSQWKTPAMITSKYLQVRIIFLGMTYHYITLCGFMIVFLCFLNQSFYRSHAIQYPVNRINISDESQRLLVRFPAESSSRQVDIW